MRCGTDQLQIDGDHTVSTELHESCDVSPTFFRLLIFLDRQMDDMSIRHFPRLLIFWERQMDDANFHISYDGGPFGRVSNS